ncbi:MFS transporter [Micropruina sp.]|uniref:MFS transporter n=1 Tax=Micropruina sp. TaxID=2737536 RepID=UPI0039E56B2E
MNSTSPSKRAATAALFALAIGSFGIGMTEFVVMGLLPDLARNLLPNTWASSTEDAIAQAGTLISLYALGVVIGAPTIAGSVARFPRHRVMIALALALTVFNALTFVAPSFEWVAASRLLAGLPHGAYFGIGALVAADILGPGRRAQGVAYVLVGLTVANVVGVPVGTFLGQHYGWRTTFMVVTGIFAIATACIAAFVPHHEGSPERTLRAELQVFRIGQVWLTLAIGAIGFGGFFAVNSYVAPMITEIAHGPSWAVPLLLVVSGIGMTIGNLAGGRLADRELRRTMLGAFLGSAMVLALIGLLAQWLIMLAVLLFALNFVGSILAPTIQTRLMDVAQDNQSIAAALNHSALNIGNSLGAFFGGAVIAAGWGFVAPAWVGVAMALVGLALGAVGFAINRHAPALEPVAC